MVGKEAVLVTESIINREVGFSPLDLTIQRGFFVWEFFWFYLWEFS